MPAEAPPRFTASADGIREAMGYAAHDLRECYDGWLQTAPQLAGTVKVRFAITPAADGTATLTDIALADSSLAHSWMEGCIIAAVRDLSFEAPADGKPLHVTYPLAFAAKKD